MHLPTTTTIEILQLLINLAGFILSLRHFVGTLSVYRYVQRAEIGNGRRILAAGHVRSEALRLGMQGILLMVATISLTLLPDPPDGMGRDILEWLLWRKFGVTLVSILLTAQTLGDAADRKILDELEAN